MASVPDRQPLHVALVCPPLPSAGSNATGTPIHIWKTQAALERRGAKVSLLELDIDRGISPLQPWRVTRKLFQDLRTKRPDVLHVHGHIPAGFTLVPAALLRIPMVVEIHGLYVPSQAGKPGTRPWLSRIAGAAEIPVLRCAGGVIVQALAMRDRLLKRGLPGDRVTTLYPGLLTAEFTDYAGPPAEFPGAEPGDIAVVYIGSTHPYQGLDLLAAAQRYLPKHFRLALVTSRDAGAPVDVVDQVGFDPSRTVVVHPSSPAAIPAWCRRADVLVHARPDVPDNINVQSKLGLYLAAGRPIVATDVGDYPALLAGSGGCVLTRPEPEAFARGVVAATSPGVAAAARTMNPSIARRHFEADTNAERLVEVYLRALGRERGPVPGGGGQLPQEPR